MIAPGMTITSGKIVTTAADGQDPEFFYQGVGFLNDGSLALDTAVPAGNFFKNGIRQSQEGAFYCTTTAAGTDIWIGGLRCSVLGQLVVEEAVATNFVNGNPLTANGALAVTDGTGAIADPFYANVVSLLHMQGANGATTTTDEKGKIWTFNGDSVISTAQSKFGTSSLFHDSGVAGYLSTPSHVDFNFPVSTAFTVELWAKAATVIPGLNYTGLWSTAVAAGCGMTQYDAQGILRYVSIDTTVLGSSSVNAGLTNWNHYALSRTTTQSRFFFNGVKVMEISSAIVHPQGAAIIGAIGGAGGAVNGQYFRGYIEEVRVTKGVARYTADFAVPTAPFPNF